MYDGEDGVMAQEAGSMGQNVIPETGSIPGTEDRIKPEGIAFTEAGVWARIATIFAGPFFNFILAFVMAVIFSAFNGVDLPVVGAVLEGSAAQEAGLEKGDVITKIGREPIHFYKEVWMIASFNEGEPLEIYYERNGKKDMKVLYPKYSEEDGRYLIGIVNGEEYLKCNALQIFQYGFYEVEYWVKSTYKSLRMLIQGQVTKDSVAGPVGIAQIVGSSYNQAEENYGTPYAILIMIEIIVLLSVNLGIMNLLPIPALDGGRLVFMLVEVIRGKPVPPEKEGMVHFAGLVVLMILMVFILYNDIMRLVR